MKKAILAVSFGTTHADADRDCIQPIEAMLARAYPDREVRRAFTSRMVAERLRSRGAEIEETAQALCRLQDDGFSDIRVVSTHIIRGGEYEKARLAAGEFRISEPLLDSDDDLNWMAALLHGIAEDEGRTLLAMGHGADHEADETYVRLQKKLGGKVLLACCDGRLTLDTILNELDALPEKKLTLTPLMLVAGSHARRQLAGEDAASWKSRLEERGFDVHVRMQGLGALEQVQARFLEKAGKILK